MRDYRDAKAMAQTLRDSLKAKSVSLTHSESLELISKILGFQDWNVLSAKIQSGSQLSGDRPRASTTPHINEDARNPAPQEVAIDPAALEGYVGFYQPDDESAVFTVARQENHLTTRLTGQRQLPIYPQTNTEFFAKLIDVQITFVVEANSHATALILRQNGRDFTMKRIEAATAHEVEGELAEKVKKQTADPGSEAALRRLITGLTNGEPNYHEMTPALAELARQQLPNLHVSHLDLGSIQSITFLGVGRQGEDSYTVKHDNGASHWRIKLAPSGLIALAGVTPGP